MLAARFAVLQIQLLVWAALMVLFRTVMALAAHARPTAKLAVQQFSAPFVLQAISLKVELVC